MASGMTADRARQILEQGNARFVAGRSEHPHMGADRRRQTAERGQEPFAAIVSCSDSRVPVELIFDCGVGDLFVVRVAGNVCDLNEVATVEYVADHLGVPLLIVMGHTHCGAVEAVATGAVLHGNLLQLRGKIMPAVDAARRNHPHMQGAAFVQEVARHNVWHSIEDLLAGSLSVRQLIRAGRLRVEGAMYDLATGQVEWLGEHPRLSQHLDGLARPPLAPLS